LLAVFGEQDAAFFFGREAATSQVLEQMSRRLEGAGLLVVSGVSGAGKSSLLRAGVLPRIRADGLAAAPGAAWWPYLVFTPTEAIARRQVLAQGWAHVGSIQRNGRAILGCRDLGLDGIRGLREVTHRGGGTVMLYEGATPLRPATRDDAPT
jgi:energy-coupling factor transporter ATP-binding protein EcfA2